MIHGTPATTKMINAPKSGTMVTTTVTYTARHNHSWTKHTSKKGEGVEQGGGGRGGRVSRLDQRGADPGKVLSKLRGVTDLHHASNDRWPPQIDLVLPPPAMPTADPGLGHSARRWWWKVASTYVLR
jgi:hypothetical protein